MPQGEVKEKTRAAPGVGVGGTDAGREGASVGGGWGWRRAVLLLVVGGVWWGVFVNAQKLVPGARAERTWSAADGKPVPSDFLFLMFPVDDNVPMFDSPGGQRVGVLRRALGNDYGELKDNKWVQVPASEPGGKNAYVRVEDLRYLSAAAAGTATAPTPNPDGTVPKPVNYVAAFAAAYMARVPGEARTTTFMRYTKRPDGLEREANIGPEEAQYVMFSLKAGPNRRQFFAKVTAEKATPLAIDRLSEGSKLQSQVLRWVIAGTAATVIGAVVGVLLGGVLRGGPRVGAGG